MNTQDVENNIKQVCSMKTENDLKKPVGLLIKRIFDLTLIFLFMPLFGLVMAIVGILIKLNSKGPVFFIQERIGKDGIPFKCIKFRTMYVNADEILKSYLESNLEAKKEWKKYKKLKRDDPRVTKIGRILRKTSLDELPQVFNVLKGDMTLVGPRPYLPVEVSEMGKYKEIIFKVLPGITGLWQVSGRNNLTFEQRLKLDTWYVLNWSLWLDFIILLKTVKVVLKKEGAY